MPPRIALAILLAAAWPAAAAEKRVHQIDSVIASQKDGWVAVQAKGAVESGGWKNPRLKVVHNDGHTVTVEFVATPPPPGMMVIQGLVPVTAGLDVKGRPASVHAQSEANEVTSQVLK